MKYTNYNNSITATHKPIAYCLYRVSTVGQVDKVKNDIPMQKEECREFAARHDWIIGKEFLEKGVSGFKVSAENRDAIQELKIAAIKGEFQILLVLRTVSSTSKTRLSGFRTRSTARKHHLSRYARCLSSS